MMLRAGWREMQSRCYGSPVVHFGRRLLHFDKLNNRSPKCNIRRQANPNIDSIIALGFVLRTVIELAEMHRQPARDWFFERVTEAF